MTLLGSHSHAIHLKPFVPSQIIVLKFPAFPSLPWRCLTRQKWWKTMNSLEQSCLQYEQNGHLNNLHYSPFPVVLCLPLPFEEGLYFSSAPLKLVLTMIG